MYAITLVTDCAGQVLGATCPTEYGPACINVLLYIKVALALIYKGPIDM